MTVRKMEALAFDPLAWLNQQDNVQRDAISQQPTACQPLSPSEELALATAVTRELIARNANIAESYDDVLAAPGETCTISCVPIARSIVRQTVNASGSSVCIRPTGAPRLPRSITWPVRLGLTSAQ